MRKQLFCTHHLKHTFAPLNKVQKLQICLIWTLLVLMVKMRKRKNKLRKKLAKIKFYKFATIFVLRSYVSRFFSCHWVVFIAKHKIIILYMRIKKSSKLQICIIWFCLLFIFKFIQMLNHSKWTIFTRQRHSKFKFYKFAIF